MSKITVLGMGAMGSRMALSLLKGGHQVTVWNRSPGKTDLIIKAGAKAAQTSRGAVQDADLAIAMVRDDQASRQVWLAPETGAMAGLSPKAIAIESSTLTVAWIQDLGRQLRDRGIALLDASVAGTLPHAEAARLIYFVGGDAEALARAKPILQTMGKQIYHVGSIGSGMTIKLGVNAMLAIQVSAMGELLGLIRGGGLDEAQATAILTATPVCSPAAKMAAEAMVKRQFSPLFPIELVEKDLNYALKTAQQDRGKLPLVDAAHQIFSQAIAQGYGDRNITGVAKLYF